MKKLIWKIRYAMRIHKRSWCNWRFCWQSAEAAIENLGDDWKDECPIDSADEELSCWSD